MYTFDYESRLSMKLSPGPEMDERDVILKQTMATGDWDFDDSESFRMVWGEEVRAWAYDATDRVEDWWGLYGNAITGSGRGRSDMEVRVAMGDVRFS